MSWLSTALWSVLQSPFKDVQYRITGDDQAVNFFNINETTGTITLSKELSEDGAQMYKARRVDWRDGDRNGESKIKFPIMSCA